MFGGDVKGEFVWSRVGVARFGWVYCATTLPNEAGGSVYYFTIQKSVEGQSTAGQSHINGTYVRKWVNLGEKTLADVVTRFQYLKMAITRSDTAVVSGFHGAKTPLKKPEN